MNKDGFTISGTEETKKEKYKEYICPACGFFFKSVAGFNETKKCLRCNWTFVSPVLFEE